jgi:O-antigen/teichoic acid export membrane protein
MLKKNIVANFFGTSYAMLLQFALLPMTLHFLGPQVLGLLGLYASMLAILAVLDFGLSPALSRELARLSVLRNSQEAMRSTVTTLEIFSVLGAGSVSLVIILGASTIARLWLKSEALSVDVMTAALQWMGLQAGLQFLTSFYNSGLVGLQKIVLSNAVASFAQTIRFLSLLAFLMFSSNVEHFFAIQAVTNVIALLFTGAALYLVLPPVETKTPSGQEIKIRQTISARLFKRYSHERFMACRRFAAGVAATSLSMLLLTQLDKLILSKLLTLENFGYYSTAASLASVMAKPAAVVSGAVLPRMTQLVASENFGELRRIYLRSSSLISWLTIPLAGLIAVFSYPLLTLYLRNPESAAAIAPLLSLLVIGSALHSVMYIPYGLTLAFGRTRLGINICLMASVVLVPLIVIGTHYQGAIGGAVGWLTMSLLYIFVFSSYIHRYCLKGELFSFYKAAIFFQTALTISILSTGTFLR